MSEDYTKEFKYLDKLRDKGSVNMYDASGPLAVKFGINKGSAIHILKHWMLAQNRQSRDEVLG